MQEFTNRRYLSYDTRTKFRYCKAIEVFMEADIVRALKIKLGARERKHFKCKEMTVGVQRLVLITPMESIEKEVAAYSN